MSECCSKLSTLFKLDDSRMDNEKKKVLVVDDDPAVSDLLVALLSEKYQALTTDFTEVDLVEFCHHEKPSCILLDVNLGTKDGRDICLNIKQSFGDSAPPIVFISGDDSEENVISCFEQGGDDFISKPFSTEQVIRKVESLLKYDTLFKNLQNQSEELSELVTTTMSQASSYGAVLNMVKQINIANTEQGISQCIFDFLASQGLTSAIYFKHLFGVSCFDQKSKICSPIIKEVFELAHNRKRIHKLGTRLMVSDKHVSILIKNPPSEEAEEYGIFIDIIAVIIEALEARYLGLLREQRLSKLHSELSQVIHDLHYSVEDVRAKKQKLIDDIVLRVGLSFHELELTERQEDFFSKMLEDTVMGHDDNNNVIMNLQNKLSLLVEEINELVEPSKPEQEEPEQIEDDIELF